jgi:hypothetical protein
LPSLERICPALEHFSFRLTGFLLSGLIILISVGRLVEYTIDRHESKIHILGKPSLSSHDASNLRFLFILFYSDLPLCLDEEVAKV